MSHKAKKAGEATLVKTVNRNLVVRLWFINTTGRKHCGLVRRPGREGGCDDLIREMRLL